MRATRLYAHARGIFLLLRMREPIKKGGATALQEFPLRHCSAPHAWQLYRALSSPHTADRNSSKASSTSVNGACNTISR